MANSDLNKNGQSGQFGVYESLAAFLHVEAFN
jgi:hypothetical protein